MTSIDDGFPGLGASNTVVDNQDNKASLLLDYVVCWFAWFAD